MSSNKNLLSPDTLLHNGTYRILRPLASGGFGNTYLARHTGLDAQMVVKEFFMKGINLRDSEGTVTVSVSDNRSTFESQLTKEKNHPLRHWFYGHFHQSWYQEIDGMQYNMLDIMELRELR